MSHWVGAAEEGGLSRAPRSSDRFEVGNGPTDWRWDEDVDVVVVGCGYSGAAASISAHDAGARVLIIEKMPEVGGISLISGGGVRVAKDTKAALSYLKWSNGRTTPEPVLAALAEGMASVGSFIEELAVDVGGSVAYRSAPGNYPFPGYETFGFVYVESLAGFEPSVAYPHARGLSAEGPLLFSVLERGLARRNISVRTRCKALHLEVDKNGQVVGLTTEDRGRSWHIHARKAVILACGGFEADYDLQAQYWRGGPALSAGFLGNTGDGIRLAQAVGADLWHMWHYHGSYGFKSAGRDYPFGVRVKRLPDWVPGSGPPADVAMTWILVDKTGRRFTCEYQPYMQDTGARDLDAYSPLTQDFPRIPCWLIVDDSGLRRYPLGRPVYHDMHARLDWSDDNQAEVASGLLKRASSIHELAGVIDVPADSLESTINRWNRLCNAGYDDDYGRPNTTMVPIASAPFYAAEIWPIVSNTQGGPRHDPWQRVLNVDGAPIPRLYCVGELGSAFGSLYLSGGNLAECFAGGRVAGQKAAEEVSI